MLFFACGECMCSHFQIREYATNQGDAQEDLHEFIIELFEDEANERFGR